MIFSFSTDDDEILPMPRKVSPRVSRPSDQFHEKMFRCLGELRNCISIAISTLNETLSSETLDTVETEISTKNQIPQKHGVTQNEGNDNDNDDGYLRSLVK